MLPTQYISANIILKKCITLKIFTKYHTNDSVRRFDIIWKLVHAIKRNIKKDIHLCRVNSPTIGIVHVNDNFSTQLKIDVD